jgi:hypothetical protein
LSERNYSCLSAAENAEVLNERVEKIMELPLVTTAEGCTRLEVYSYLGGLDTALLKVKKWLKVIKKRGTRGLRGRSITGLVLPQDRGELSF